MPKLAAQERRAFPRAEPIEEESRKPLLKALATDAQVATKVKIGCPLGHPQRFQFDFIVGLLKETERNEK